MSIRDRRITSVKQWSVLRGSSSHQAGLSLIELMIGLVVGLVILGGVLQTMLASKEASSARQSMATITDNARFLFDFMGRDLRMTGRGFAATSSPLSYSVASGLIAQYDIPASGGDSRVQVTFVHEGNEIRYARVVDGTVVVAKQVLVDRVQDFEVAFGYESGASSITYTAYDAPASLASVVAIRTRVTFENAVTGDFSFNAASTPMISTFALRNRIATLIE